MYSTIIKLVNHFHLPNWKSVNPEHWPYTTAVTRREDHPNDNDINKTKRIPHVNRVRTICIIITDNEMFINIINSRFVFRSYARAVRHVAHLRRRQTVHTLYHRVPTSCIAR